MPVNPADDVMAGPRAVVAHRPDGALVHGSLLPATEPAADSAADSRATPLIVLDGIGCYGWAFPEISPVLARDRPVLHVHYRGHGPSPTPPRPWDLRMSTLAHDAMALADAAAFGPRVAVLGYSMGFQVALECVRLHRARVSGLINIAGPPGRALHTFQGTDAFARLLPLLANAARLARRVTDDLWKSVVPHRLALEIGLVTAVNGNRLAPEYLERYMADLAAIHPELFLSMLEEADAHDGRPVLPTIDIPTTFIAGARDTFVPLAVLEACAAAVPHATVHRFDDATHAVPAEYIQETTTLLREALHDLDAGAVSGDPA